MTGDAPSSGCVFCEARPRQPATSNPRSIVFRGRTCFVILNLYPYNNGHLMVVPNRHIGIARGADAGGAAAS